MRLKLHSEYGTILLVAIQAPAVCYNSGEVLFAFRQAGWPERQGQATLEQTSGSKLFGSASSHRKPMLMSAWTLRAYNNGILSSF